MQTTLCFDFGNTRLKCAIFENETLKDVVILNDAGIETMQQFLHEQKATHSILSSVVNHPPEIEQLLASETTFHKLGHTSKLPFTTPVGKPETIGADRLALIAAAVEIHPGKHNLVIGLGSCITYNFVNKFHEFLGGSISPGLEMRFKAMNQLTAKLPLIKPHWNFPLTGYDTKTNMLSGVILGMCKEIEGIIEEYEMRYANFNALLTGGDMGFFVPHFKKKIFADPHLIYKGLYAINKSNS
ncbi:type III pantothenate kinase [Panacibacter ginsenosidivorans]|uniref:Type III pantothenate kinase n=1 Tax=Panacibacter ginsenosidivorans TaxID=1813871 RepID=A0A5B8V8I5_9BACT|nr:type III pantothenate kinase [Panacibacter ginsenosidivorans]QEC67475.1 type III pantothenate kinase [Panacibacter ginsenosidivorans]